MEQIVFCPFCKERSKQQISVQVTMLGRENRFDDAWCPMCNEKFAGRVLLGEMEEGTSIPKIELQKKVVRIGSHGSIMQPL
jgi:hypothetical protein